MIASFGKDTVDGGDGGIKVDLEAGTVGSSAAVNFENFTGTNGNDVIRGDAGDNVIRGGKGNDALFGGGGAETFIFSRTIPASTSSPISAPPKTAI